MNAKTTVAQHLGEQDILVTDPSLVKAHGEAQHLHGREAHQRNDNDIKDFLNAVCVQRQHGTRMFREVMRAVELPKVIAVVHQTMVPVEPKVHGKTVADDLGHEPRPAHRRR